MFDGSDGVSLITNHGQQTEWNASVLFDMLNCPCCENSISLLGTRAPTNHIFSLRVTG